MKLTRFVLPAVAALSSCAVAAVSFVAARARQTPAPSAPATPLVTGRVITPQGTQTNVGSFPVNLLVSPDGRFVVVTNVGSREHVSVLSTIDGTLVSQLSFDKPRPDLASKKLALYYGLAWGQTENGATTLYAARGADEKVSVLSVAGDGTLSDTGKTLDMPSGDKPGGPRTHYLAGLALSGDGSRLFVANNAASGNNMTGSLGIFDTKAGTLVGTVATPGYPLAVAAPKNNNKVYVASEQRGVVAVVDVQAKKVANQIETGAQPTALLLDRAQRRLFVANGGSDTISVIDTAQDKVTQTILLRPAGDARGLPGATPTGLALAPDEKQLFVSLGDLNAVAVVDLAGATVAGYLPAGWYPSAVAVSPDGARLFVANAKGVALRNPNGAPKPGLVDRAQYIQNLIEGTVATIDLADAQKNLAALTAQTIANNRVRPDLLERAQKALKNPGIEHVFYIIKENRTYDQVLGDLEKGNGDRSLVLFGRDITPNQHALAERFVLLDNFYCAAEVSGDGWNWSTAGMIAPYTARNVPHGYGGRVRPYDYEGTNNGRAPDRVNVPDVARPAGGYIWDACARAGVRFRNYGFFADDLELPRQTAEQGTEGVENTPTKTALVGNSDPNFRQYDTTYPDSEAWVVHGVPPAPGQRKSYGSNNDPARLTAWKREFAAYVKNNNLPAFQMIRLGRDHTAGTTPGQSSPRAMVADNDYAVGQLVETVSRSPFWKKSAIFILEDDAQNGYDHVDAHRSIAFVVSPFVRAGTHDSRFYNTDGMLRTIELLLGIGPMNLYDATADPLAVFAAAPDNDAPYAAILPAKAIIGEVNGQRAYRARDSARLLNPLVEESAPDEELNDILWHAIKGNVPAPPRRYGLRVNGTSTED